MPAVQPRYLPVPVQDAPDTGRLILRDGTTAAVRPAGAGDLPALEAFFRRLSPQSRVRRFHTAGIPGRRLLEEHCDNADPRQRLTLLVLRLHGAEPQVIACGTYYARDERSAEVAFAVEDQFQGKGLGTLLLERLAALAIRHGFDHFWAIVQPDNPDMLNVFRDSGFEVRESLQGGAVEVELSVVPTAASVARQEVRDRLATAASLRPFFLPRAVALIGASRQPASIGHRLMRALLDNLFQGPVYLVNPKASEIAGQPCYPSILKTPQPVDLAVIAVPRDAVPSVVEECAAHGVRALVLITAGYAETGAEGRSLQRQLTEKVRGLGMRMVGPNCMGLLNADPAVRLNASFAAALPPPGTVAMLSQSGALGLGILAVAAQYSLGLSTFVSVGNKADVSSNDLLQYWEEDPATEVILLYLESFGNPRRFARIAPRVGRKKPVVAVKGGRSAAGSRAAQSHTAALAASDVAVDALFSQTGVIRADTLEEMFELAGALSNQPLPVGKRVGIVTNAGGPGILCADACEAGGLVLPELSEATRAILNSFLPKEANCANPVDMIASASPEQFKLTVETILCSGEIDALIVIHIPVLLHDPAAIHQAIIRGVEASHRAGTTAIPVLACLMAESGEAPRLLCGPRCIPVYRFPEAPARALSKIARYVAWRNQPPGLVPEFEDMDWARIQAVCRKALDDRGDGWLSAAETRALLQAARLPLPPGGVAATPDAAALLADAVGYPVAVKLASHRIVHKTEVGGVRLGLADAAAVRQAFDAIRNQLARTGQLDAMEGVVVQPMLKEGVEVLAGVSDDPLFGPLVAFGLGGIHVEILRDVCFRITPLTDLDAATMVRSIRGWRLLEGYRGHPPADVQAIEELLLRLSRLVDEVHAITELDLNPVFAFAPGRGCQIADARIRVTRR